jgi:DNA-binding transcriptional LysR family regulator
MGKDMKKRSPDFRYLRAFVLTANHLNFSKAADELGIAQSAVSRQIKLLEESVGHQLIVRSSKKVLLTKMGEELLREFSHFESRIQEIFFGESHQTIHIGILHGFLETWFNDVIVEFSKLHHPHQLIIEVNTLEQLKEKLHNGHYDLIFTTENFQSDLVSSLKLFEEKMVLIGHKKIDLKEAHQEPWIVYSNQDHLFHLSKKRSSQVIVVNSITAMIKLVRKGLGIAIVPDHTVEDKKGLFLSDISGLPKQYIYLSSLNLQKRPTYIKNLLDIIKKDQN